MKANTKIPGFLKHLVNFGIDPKLTYWELRKAKLLNVIVFSISFILIIFLAINIVQENYFLAVADVALFFVVCIPSLILQYKKKYAFNLFFITSAFFIHTTLLTILEYDINRQTEHVLPAISIMVIFLFDGWKKNLMFLIFPLSFFTIRFTVMYMNIGHIEFKALHLIYAIEFLIVFVIASYFKADMISFYNKLQAANETKVKLFRMISHDLKNPFGSLLGTSELQSRFIENGEIDKLKKSSEIIKTSSNKIYDLLQSLLDWSMTQSETFVAKFEEVNITLIIEKVIDFCRITADPKSIQIKFNPEEAIVLNCDAAMTEISLRNLLMNAIKFSNRNDTIEIKQTQDSDNVIISIIDNGVGIAQEDLDHLFDTHMIHTSYGTENEKGTGLGLMICKEFIQKQGAQLSAESELGKGSVFSISFPLKK